ncbi:hypothetical protein DICVIV_11098 [Dictyocaulus viviparus]|uniref:Uncharacterized protein n=1 Tax=Dictyocaulus viviparus TaxID=29172 RepID=A0A0D8XE31_DICVI|nr:hypothetical protein DICVIV_11098 [Dictyocaulus viviparus]
MLERYCNAYSYRFRLYRRAQEDDRLALVDAIRVASLSYAEKRCGFISPLDRSPFNTKFTPH